jgi:hypothetical protein
MSNTKYSVAGVTVDPARYTEAQRKHRIVYEMRGMDDGLLVVNMLRQFCFMLQVLGSESQRIHYFADEFERRLERGDFEPWASTTK